jgi:hypothetical protein
VDAPFTTSFHGIIYLGNVERYTLCVVDFGDAVSSTTSKK